MDECDLDCTEDGGHARLAGAGGPGRASDDARLAGPGEQSRVDVAGGGSGGVPPGSHEDNARATQGVLRADLDRVRRPGPDRVAERTAFVARVQRQPARPSAVKPARADLASG